MISRQRQGRRLKDLNEYTVFPGDRVVIDANVFADFVVSRIIHEPVGNRAIAAERVFSCCAVLMASNALLNEIIPAANRRGWRLPPGSAKEILDALEANGKLVNYRQSAIQATPLPRKIKQAVPKEDHHVIELAAASSAKFILTDDKDLQESGRKKDVHRLVTILPVEQALRIPTPKKPCCG